jgi:hypothetical protein
MERALDLETVILVAFGNVRFDAILARSPLPTPATPRNPNGNAKRSKQAGRVELTVAQLAGRHLRDSKDSKTEHEANQQSY